MKYLDQLNRGELRDKKVVLRVDFNVPITEGGDQQSEIGKRKLRIEESFRIKAHQETVDFLINNGAKILLISHLEAINSFGPIVKEIEEILGQTLTLVPHSELDSLDRLFKTCPVLLLDNIRQDPREKQNDSSLARELAAGFNFFVNDAFAVSHRAHASVEKLAGFLPAFAGFLIKKEMSQLSAVLQAPARGKIIVLGGAKISTKLPVISNFSDKADKILIGGALANNFFKAQGFKVGSSVIEEAVVLSFLSSPREREKLILPQDIIVSTKGSSRAESSAVKNLEFSQLIADIGPQSRQNFTTLIRQAQMVIWNGPMGLAEEEVFAQGTKEVAKAVSEAPLSVVGGGDTIALLDRWGMLKNFSFVSTGGGAMLDFLAGKKLPGLEALK